MRAIASSPVGLFIGSANPSGRRTTSDGTNIWLATTSTTYNNPADGTDIFLVNARDGAGNVEAESDRRLHRGQTAGPPGAPSPASASVVSQGNVRVTWTNVAGETSYNVQRCLPMLKCSYAAVASNVPADTTFFDNATSGTPGTIYTYRVQACNGAGCSAWAVTNNVTLP